ncbi:pre-mRNA-splicing factor CWC22 homolog [Haliotis rufescens]|uniref:pre-mRNA-splicing factor CWC22 homolog n=1 Tax=Haliotis rufescens TaxID=6454 RepID=UPI00201EE219|nr:pre-mRNA-splicing factor CWC22 homolog [Haliotis rufescens]
MYLRSLLLAFTMTRIRIQLLVVVVLPLCSHGNSDWDTIKAKLAQMVHHKHPDPSPAPSEIQPTFVLGAEHGLGPDAAKADVELAPDEDVVWDVKVKSLLDSGTLTGPGSEDFKDELEQMEKEGKHHMELEFVSNPQTNGGEVGSLSTEVSKAADPVEVIGVEKKRNKRRRKKNIAGQKGRRGRNRALRRQEKQRQRELKKKTRLERKRNRQAQIGIVGRRKGPVTVLTGEEQKTEQISRGSQKVASQPAQIQIESAVTDRQPDRASIPVFQPWKVQNQTPDEQNADSTNIEPSEEDKTPQSEGDPNVERQPYRASIPVFQPWKVQNQSPDEQNADSANIESGEEDKTPQSEGDPNVERQPDRASIPVFQPWKVENQTPVEQNADSERIKRDSWFNRMFKQFKSNGGKNMVKTEVEDRQESEENKVSNDDEDDEDENWQKGGGGSRNKGPGVITQDMIMMARDGKPGKNNAGMAQRGGDGDDRTGENPNKPPNKPEIRQPGVGDGRRGKVMNSWPLDDKHSLTEDGDRDSRGGVVQQTVPGDAPQMRLHGDQAYSTTA